MKPRSQQVYTCALLLAFLHNCTRSQIGDLLGQKLFDFENNGLGWQEFQAGSIKYFIYYT